MSEIAVRVWISGRVQGVGYRFATIRQAEKLGISGWVQNLSDGRVTAVFQGKKTAVEQMVQWCHRGPAAAVVKGVEVQQMQLEPISGFELKY